MARVEPQSTNTTQAEHLARLEENARKSSIEQKLDSLKLQRQIRVGCVIFVAILLLVICYFVFYARFADQCDGTDDAPKWFCEHEQQVFLTISMAVLLVPVCVCTLLMCLMKKHTDMLKQEGQLSLMTVGCETPIKPGLILFNRSCSVSTNERRLSQCCHSTTSIGDTTITTATPQPADRLTLIFGPKRASPAPIRQQRVSCSCSRSRTRSSHSSTSPAPVYDSTPAFRV